MDKTVILLEQFKHYASMNSDKNPEMKKGKIVT